MKQASFSEAEFAAKKRVTRRERLLQTLDLRRLAPDLALAQTPDPVDLLGQIDDLKQGCERAHEFSGIRRRQRMQSLAQIVGRIGLTATMADRGPAYGLDVLEELTAELFVDDLADEVAQLAHVLAQGRVLGCGGLLVTRIGCGYHGNLLGDALARPCGWGSAFYCNVLRPVNAPENGFRPETTALP